MITNWLILDVATAPLPDAARYLEGSVRPPANYRDEQKIADYIAEKEAERVAMAATDVDLAMVTGVGILDDCHDDPTVAVHNLDDPPEHRELRLLIATRAALREPPKPTIITFGGFNFDLPLLMRRARYLGVDFPTLNLDRYKSPHVDLCEVLSDRNPQRKRPLGFYVKRHGWDLVKPLSGAEEAQVPQTGKWDELAASLRHDVTATYRLACWLGIIQAVQVEQEEPVVG